MEKDTEVNMINDILRTNKEVLFKAIYSLKNNLELLLVGGFYLLVILLSARLIPMFGFLGGLISVLIQSALLSNYLYLMHCIIFEGKFDTEDFKAGFLAYFRMLWVIYLVLYTAMYALSLIMLPIGAIFGTITYYIIPIAWFVAFIALNAIPETVYQKKYMELDTFKYSFHFIKENPVEWFLPNIIMFAILYGVYHMVSSFMQGLLINLPIDIQIAVYWVSMIIILQVVIGFIMLYRGFLFKILSTTTKRKRYFMRDPHESR